MAWQDVLSARFTEAIGVATENFVIGVVNLIVVLAFLFVGYLVSKLLLRILHAFLESIKLEKTLEKKGVHDALMGFSVTGILSTFVKLLTYAVFLGIAADVVNLTFLSDLVRWFVGYIPLLLQGTTILILALLAADYVTDRIKGSKMPFARILGLLIQVFVVYTALVMAFPLILPNVDVDILKTTFLLIVGAAAIALGLGFAIAIGLGGKDMVAQIAKEKKRTIDKLI